jgi:anaerobic ribonucleoside-triphosphate reductase activating protein
MSRHHGTTRDDVVVLSRRKTHTARLGPGDRAVIWVAGCELRCNGCIAPDTHPHAGTEIPVDELATWITRHANDGVTISGGEPMLQASAVTRVIDRVREARSDLHVMLYSGYRLEWLRSRGSVDQQRLLKRLDLLVDGPYVERFHAPIRWRGSTNQRLIDLSGRTPGLDEPDEAAGIDLELNGGLTVELTGVPPTPGFRRWLEDTL